VLPENGEDRIQEILESAQNIVAFTKNKNLRTFRKDQKTIKAVAYELTTLSKTAVHVSKNTQLKFKEVPWEKVRAFSQPLTLDDFQLDEEVLWKTAKEDIPLLIEELEKPIQK
jgi:uncharacterized protein with HEPN domain